MHSKNPKSSKVVRHWSDQTLLLLMLAAVTLGVYWPATHFDFVNCDDPDYVTANPHVQTGVTKAGVVWAFTTGEASNWHPLTWLSHMLDRQFYGMRPAGHHLTSILFHTANALLLFAVFRQMTGALWRSALLAALFALHPLRVESVAWVSERKDVLSTFFWLLSTWAYVRYCGQSKVRSPKSKVSYILSLLFFALGLMSKPMLVTLPFVLLLLDYWPLKRSAESKNLEGRQGQGVSWRLLVIEKTPFLALALASSIVTFEVQKRGGAVASLSNVPLDARLANAPVSYLRYAGKLLWPGNLSVMYPLPGSWPPWLVLAAALFLVGVTAGVCWAARRRPYLFVGWFWFVGTLVPVIGLVQVGLQSMADRYTYVPGIGLLIILVWGMGDVLMQPRFLGWGKTAAVTTAGLALVACVFTTRDQLQYWQNSETLFRHNLAVTSRNDFAQDKLGACLLGQGRIDEAMEHFQQALQINPRSSEAYSNLGAALANKGRFDQAIEKCDESIRLDPNNAEAYNNLGAALAGKGMLDQAIDNYDKATRLKPNYAESYYDLGNAWAARGQMEQAIQNYRKAIQLNPDSADARNNLGNALATQGQLPPAIECYRAAIQIDPQFARAYKNLGGALVRLGNLDEAVQQFYEAVRLGPNDVSAQFGLGDALAAKGRGEEAIAHYREALQLNPKLAGGLADVNGALNQRAQDAGAAEFYRSALRSQPEDAEAHFKLGCALARLGHTDEAIAELAEAVRLKPGYAEARQQLQALTQQSGK